MMTSLPLIAVLIATASGAPAADPWARVRPFIGTWNGTAQGEPGTGAVKRGYELILGSKFLEERNVSTYQPKEAGKPGEVHEHRSFFSFDKKRKRLVLRQFHQEGFVNQYVLDEEQSSSGHLVFVSEVFENLDPRWRAREIYDWTGDDAFTETFEIAMPGKDFSLYSKNTFTRMAPK